MRNGFTLIELIAVMAIILVLASVLLVSLTGTQDSYMRLQTKNLTGEVTRVIQLFSQNENSFPAPDDSCFLEIDWSLDDNKASVLKDFDNWPVLNKLVFKFDFNSINAI